MITKNISCADIKVGDRIVGFFNEDGLVANVSNDGKIIVVTLESGYSWKTSSNFLTTIIIDSAK